VNYDSNGKKVATSKWKDKTLLSSDLPDIPTETKPGDDKLPEPDGL
jgi:hypothetical protein